MKNKEGQFSSSYHDQVFMIKREQGKIKKSYTNIFLGKLEEIIEKCFLKSSERKECFVTKEKLILEFLQLLQSQKKFKSPEIIHEEITSLALFDHETNLLGRILNINLEHKTVDFITLKELKNHEIYITKSLSKVDFFDPNSLKMQVYYSKQKMFYDCYNYKESFDMITGKVKDLNMEEERNYLSQQPVVKLDRSYYNRTLNTDLKD